MTNETTAPVEQRHRNAAAEVHLHRGLPRQEAASIKRGEKDDHWSVKAFVNFEASLTRAEQPRPTEAGGWQNPAPDAAAPAVTTGYHFVMSTADLRPTEAPPSLQKAQTSPDATPGKAMADDGLAGLVERVAKAGIAERRATIEQIVHECPKLQGEPSRDCIAALSGVATSAARQAARAVIAALTGTDGLAAENEACAAIAAKWAEQDVSDDQRRMAEDIETDIRARMGDG